MIQMLRKEACSGAIDDLAHVRTETCLSDCLTKQSAKPDALIRAVETGLLPSIDTHPAFRSLLKHRAFMVAWLKVEMPHCLRAGAMLLGEPATEQQHFSAFHVKRECALHTCTYSSSTAYGSSD